MKLKIENFALFKDETVFEIAPLTLLIGANSSGKSTFLKALDIAHKLKFESSVFDLDSVKDYLKPNTSFKVEINSNLYLRLDIPIIDVPAFISADSFGEIKKKITYVNKRGEQVITVESLDGKIGISSDGKIGDLFDDEGNSVKSASQVKVTVNKYLLRKLITDTMELHEVPKRLVDDVGLLKFNWIIGDKESKQSAESWLLKAFGVYDTSGGSTEEDIKFVNREIPLKGIGNDSINQLMMEFKYIMCQLYGFQGNDENSYSFFNSLVPIFRPVIKESYELQIISLNNIGDSRRLYPLEHPFSNVLRDISSYDDDPTVGYILEWFTEKWMGLFFPGKDLLYELKSIKNRRSQIIAYEFTLGGKDLVEWGTGAYRIINYIFKLGCYLERNANIPFYWNPESTLEINKRNFKQVLELHVNKRFENRFSDMICNNDLLIIEEPEMNLHPDHQCLLAEMLFDFTTFIKSNIVIETHSEYMIRTLQFLRTKEENFSKKHCNIINFGFGEKLGKVKNIKIEDDGSLSDSFYSGFMNHSQELQLKLLRNNQNISSN